VIANENQNAGKGEEKPLRLVKPGSYALLIKELESFHLHSYDMKASAIEEGDGITIVVRFGEQLNHAMKQFFTHETIQNADSLMTDFFRKVAEACKQALIADYYKMMKL